MGEIRHTLRISVSEKSLDFRKSTRQPQFASDSYLGKAWTSVAVTEIYITGMLTLPRRTYRCANHADVTIDNFSLNGPKCSGPSVTTTTAFCTVDLVTSGGRWINVLASICLVQEIPKSDVAGCGGVASRRSVK
jgi:hypothetical protein